MLFTRYTVISYVSRPAAGNIKNRKSIVDVIKMWKNHCVSSNPNFVILSLFILILLHLKLEQSKRGNFFPIKLEKDMNSIKSGKF